VFQLVVSFGRSAIRLNEDSVGLMLQTYNFVLGELQKITMFYIFPVGCSASLFPAKMLALWFTNLKVSPANLSLLFATSGVIVDLIGRGIMPCG
jgi:hypothetical protein